jgi:phage terminase large subunit-like protein
MIPFKLTERQQAAQSVVSGTPTHCMLFGGGRSGKTFLTIRNIITRALKAPGSRHLVIRQHFNHCKQSIVLDTFPKVMRTAFPGLVAHLNKTDWFATLPNEAEIWFGGLDDGVAMEKILGKEFVTIYVNEASQVQWNGYQTLMTRLAQKTEQVLTQSDGNEVRGPMKLRMWSDCNPPSKAHWSYKVFKQKLNPDSGEPLPDPENYTSFQMNPGDNSDNLAPEYLAVLASMSGRMRRRFVDGQWAEATPNALFDEGSIDAHRVTDGRLPDMVRVVVALDPSGASDDAENADNDEIGIFVAGLGTDGRGYLLEDLTVKAGPATWGRVGVEAYLRHKADAIVGETNFGGGMVQFVVRTAAAAHEAKPRVNFKMVTASRGKVQRAEPFSALYEQGKVRHVGYLAKLEDELCAFSTAGYTGPRSPNRADAAIWALAELFPAIVAGPKVEKPKRERNQMGAGSWMG